MGRPLPTDWLEVAPAPAPEVDEIPLQPFGTPPAPRTLDLNDWLATNSSATRQSDPPSSPPSPPPQEWRRHAYLADRALEISRRLADVRAQGNGAVLGISDLFDARASQTSTPAAAPPADEHEPAPRGSRPAYPTLSERAAEQLGLTLAPRRAHAPVPPTARVSGWAAHLGPISSSFPPPSPRPRHRTTSPPTPSAPLSTTEPPPAPREALIPLPPVRTTHSPSSREPSLYQFGQSTTEPGSALFAPPAPAPTAEQRQASISEASSQLSSRVDRLASFRDRIAASSAAGRPGERDAILRNARNALETAVRFAERLEQATRELSRISDTSADLAPPPSSSPAPRTSTPPPADRRLPSTSLSLQRSIDQLRAASARIDRVLDQHLTPSERLRPPEPSPASSSPRSSRSAFRPPLTALPAQPSLSPYRPFSVPAPGQPTSGVHRGGTGLSSGLVLLAAPRRRTTTAAAVLTDEETEVEAEYPRRRQNENGSWVKLDRNGDAIDDDLAREKEARPHRRRELIGR